MRTFSFVIEFLVLAFMVTAFYFMLQQPHIDEAKVKRDADKSSNDKLDKLNNLLEEDSTALNVADSLNP